MFAFDRRLLDTAARIRWRVLPVAALTTAVLFLQFWQPEAAHLHPFSDDRIDVLQYLWFAVIRTIHIWLWLLVCIGFAAQYLNRPSRWLTQLNLAVYPVFCLHLPVLVWLEFHILPLDWSIPAKFLSISIAAVLVLAVLYMLIRPLTWVHPLIGMRAQTFKTA